MKYVSPKPNRTKALAKSVDDIRTVRGHLQRGILMPIYKRTGGQAVLRAGRASKKWCQGLLKLLAGLSSDPGSPLNWNARPYLVCIRRINCEVPASVWILTGTKPGLRFGTVASSMVGLTYLKSGALLEPNDTL